MCDNEVEIIKNNTEMVKRRRVGYLYALFRRFKKNMLSIIGTTIFLSIVFLAIFAPIISPYPPSKQFWEYVRIPPCSKFPLGTDDMGRDILSRLIWGARVSLLVGIISTAISTSIGVSIGAVSGYRGGRADMLFMEITNMIMTLPTTLLLITIVAVLRYRSLSLISAVIGLVGWTGLARLVRAETLSIKERPYVEGAKAIGLSELNIIVHYVLPNAVGPIVTNATYNLALAILWEAFLSFLGLGDPLAISWGMMMQRGYALMRFSWWMPTFPGLAIFITVLGINFLGDGLRDAFDVRTRV